MKTKKLFLFLFVSLFFVFVFCSFLEGVEEKVKLNYCEFAASSLLIDRWEFDGGSGKEADVFFPWNEERGEGIFANLTNSKLEFGVQGVYNIDYFGSQRKLYNEFQETNRNSSYPILTVSQSNNKKFIYFRCNFIVGDETLFLESNGFTQTLYPTNDFNLTKNIIPYQDSYINIQDISKGSSVSYLNSKISFNEIGTTFSLNNLADDKNNVIYKNTRPYAIYRSSNFAYLPTSFGVLAPAWLLRSSGSRTNYIPGVSSIFFYVNNSNVELKKYLAPIIINYSKFSSQGDSFSFIFYPSRSAIGNQDFIFSKKGTVYNHSFSFYNPYLFDLNFSTKIYFGSDGWFVVRGFLLPTYSSESLNSNQIIPSKEILNFNFGHNFSSSTKSSPKVTSYVYTYPESGVLSSRDGVDIFRDSFPYLTFQDIGLKSVLIDSNSDQILESYFQLNPGLFLEPTFFVGKLNDSDYYFRVDLYSVEKDTYTSSQIFQDSNRVFSKVYIPGEGVLSSLKKNVVYRDFFVNIPISSDWGPGYYYPKITAILNASYDPYPDLNGEEISRDKSFVYFKSGDTIGKSSSRFSLYSGHTLETKSLTIYNPSTFSRNCVDLILQNYDSSKNNFTVLGIPSEKICLDPLKKETILINVSSKENYNFSKNEHEEGFKIKVTSTAKDLEAPMFLDFSVGFSEDTPCKIEQVSWIKDEVSEGELVNISLSLNGDNCLDGELGVFVKKCKDEQCTQFEDSPKYSENKEISSIDFSISWKSKVFVDRNYFENFKVVVSFLENQYNSSNFLKVNNPDPLILKSARIF